MLVEVFKISSRFAAQVSRDPLGRVKRSHMKIQALVLIVLCGCVFACGRQIDNSASKDSLSVSQLSVVRAEEVYGLDREQRLAVNRLLADSVHWRLAVDSDNSNPGLEVVKKEIPVYHPYVMQSDIDLDNRVDFAIGLLRDSTIALFWFSKTDSGYSAARFAASATWFDECGFAMYPRPGQLSFGRFNSDDGVLFTWDSVKKDLTLSPETEEDNPSE